MHRREYSIVVRASLFCQYSFCEFLLFVKLTEHSLENLRVLPNDVTRARVLGTRIEISSF